MGKEIKIWYDKEGDYLEVLFERKGGYFKETENDAVAFDTSPKSSFVGTYDIGNNHRKSNQI